MAGPLQFVRPEVPEGETYLTPDDFEAAKTVRQTHENVVLMSGTTENGNNIRSDPLLRAGKYEGDILGFVNASKMHQYIRVRLHEKVKISHLNLPN